MANYKSEIAKLVARCRRIGWPVETPGSRGADWTHKITFPDDGTVLTLHKTPRDAGVSIEKYYRELRAHGFIEAEAAWEDGHERRRQQNLAVDRAKNETLTKKLSAKAAAEAERVARAAGPYAPKPVSLEWITAKHEWPQTQVVIMTPDVAQKMLDTMNVHNRKEGPGRVRYFEGVIEAGDFGCTHQGGAVDWNGVLQDGQSRLRAIVNMDTPVVMQWSVGMDPANFPKIDTGGPRSAKDTAYIKGKADPATSSVAAKMLMAIDLHGPDAHVRSRSGRVSNDTVDKALDRFGSDLDEAIELAREIKKVVRKANVSGLTTAIYLIRARLPKDDPRVTQFLDDLLVGGSARTEAVWKLRQKLINGPTERKAYNMWECAALTIKAWNVRHTGKRVTDLVWRPGNEPFPAHVFLPPPVELVA